VHASTLSPAPPGVGAGEPEPDAMAERVADQLRDLVIRGALRPGERIVERRLCEALGVSRTPMREALKLLRQDGLIELSRHRGARVAPYDGAEAEKLFEVIAALEALAAAGFCAAADPENLARLETLHAEMLAHRREGRLDPYFDVNSAIHDLIIEGARNPVLAESHRRLMLRARRGRYMAIMDAERWDHAVREHEALLAALRARSVEACRAIWEAHLRNTGLAVAQALRGESA
jgi:DNA-binding GntR family transcriptional regulator